MNMRTFWERLERRLRQPPGRGAPPSEGGDIMLALFRPNLGATPEPVRRFLEPLVAVCSLVVMSALVAVGCASFVVFLLAAAMVYGLLTQVFGIDLDLRVPSAHS